MRCPSCGLEIDAQTSACPHCGASLLDVVADVEPAGPAPMPMSEVGSELGSEPQTETHDLYSASDRLAEVVSTSTAPEGDIRFPTAGVPVPAPAGVGDTAEPESAPSFDLKVPAPEAAPASGATGVDAAPAPDPAATGFEAPAPADAPESDSALTPSAAPASDSEPAPGPAFGAASAAAPSAAPAAEAQGAAQAGQKDGPVNLTDEFIERRRRERELVDLFDEPKEDVERQRKIGVGVAIAVAVVALIALFIAMRACMAVTR